MNLPLKKVPPVSLRRLGPDVNYWARKVAKVIDLSKYRGPKGRPGVEGDKGNEGDDGSRGRRGRRGLTGVEGLPGVQGLDGAPGVEGRQGEIGPQGLQGDKGDKGDPGEKGDAPAHEWNGTKLRFRLPTGLWGRFTNLKGDTGGRGGSAREQFTSIVLNGTDLEFRKGTTGPLGSAEDKSAFNAEVASKATSLLLDWKSAPSLEPYACVKI